MKLTSIKHGAIAIAAAASALAVALAGAHAQDAGGSQGDAAAPSAAEIAAGISHYGQNKGAALVLPVAALAVPEVRAAVTPIVINPETGVAMEGYDPVGFFTEGKAMKGDAAFMVEYQGAMFLFATAENRDLFAANPEKYAPAHGGYCSQTLAQGSLTPASPLNWTIHGDRLFFTRSPEANEAFRAERTRVITASDKYYADVTALFLTGPGTANVQ
ncbi:MAG: YHS domain-containing (seleno)protein [Pseudomonadota bacterium]